MTELKALTVLSFHMFFRASHGFPADITAIEPTKAQMSIARWEKIALYQMLQKQSSFKLKAQGELSNPQKMHGLLSNSFALATCQPILGQCEKHLYFSSVEVPRPGASHFEDLPQRCW